ncbi:MAG TPA: phage shock protein PspA [Woeseiaceae bacterium]|nr:phage shock protein PspA [Woeseiaceae bacterium]
MTFTTYAEDFFMGIFTRFSDIVNSNINAILDKAEDPEKIIRLMIQEMEDTLVEVRSAAARSIADKKDLNRKLESLDRELVGWADKAELALRKGREDLAKAALIEKSRVAAAVEALKRDYHAVDEGLAKLNDDIARLEAKLEDAKARQKSLLARHKTANSRLAARKKIYDYKIDDALVRFEQYTRRIDDVEGRIEAYDMGLPKDLNSAFQNLEAEESILKELDDLKRRVTGEHKAEAE